MIRPLQPLQPTPPPGPAPAPPTATVAQPPVAVPLSPLPPPINTTAPAVLNTTALAPADEGLGQYLFGSVDYLLFKVRRGPTPPLVQVLPSNLANAVDLPPNA